MKKWKNACTCFAGFIAIGLLSQDVQAQCVPDASLSIDNSSLDYTSGWQSLFPVATLAFPVSQPTGYPAQVYGAIVEIGAGYNGGEDLLRINGALPTGITATVAANRINFSGDQSASAYQTALQLVQYQNSSGLTGDVTTRAVSVSLDRFFPLARCPAQRPAENEIVYDYADAANGHTVSGHAFAYNSRRSLFPARRAYANGLNLDGESGYMVNETSKTETDLVAGCFPQNTYAGASDHIPITGGVEGDWYWVDGPESGMQFLDGNCTRPGPCTILDPDGAGPLGAYNPFVGAEPNDYPNRSIGQEEDFSERRWAGNGWNDIFTNRGAHPSLVEFGNWQCPVQGVLEQSREIVFERRVDLEIEKTAGSGSYTPGGTGSYTLRVCNNGPQDVAGAVVADTLPDGVTVNGNWICFPDPDGACISGSPPGTGATGTGNLAESIDLPNGSCLAYTVPVLFASSAASY